MVSEVFAFWSTDYRCTRRIHSNSTILLYCFSMLPASVLGHMLSAFFNGTVTCILPCALRHSCVGNGSRFLRWFFNKRFPLIKLWFLLSRIHARVSLSCVRISQWIFRCTCTHVTSTLTTYNSERDVQSRRRSKVVTLKRDLLRINLFRQSASTCHIWLFCQAFEAVHFCL